MKEYPDAVFQNFKKPTFSGPTPRFPIASNMMLRHQRVCRAEHCLQFKRGKCNYGVNCIFSHISTVENNNSLHSSDEEQEIIHRGKICSWGKECPYGNRCRFLHTSVWGGFDSNRYNASVTLVNSVAGESGMGFDGMKRRRPWNSSYGGREMEEKNAVWKKTKFCIKWESTGTCSYGARCCFAHGKAELRQVNAVPAMEPANAFAANTPHIVTRDAISCKKTRTVSEKHEKDGKCYFKWNSIEKISQVYADWIDDISAVQVASV